MATMTDARADTAPMRAFAPFAVGYCVHSADHVRCGIAHTPPLVVVLGTALGIAAAVLLGRLLRGADGALPWLIATVSAVGIGFLAVHLPPRWGPLSQPYGAWTEPASWAALIVALVGSAASVVLLTREKARRDRAGRSNP